MERGPSRNMYEGHMDKDKRGGFAGGRWGGGACWGENGDHCT